MKQPITGAGNTSSRIKKSESQIQSETDTENQFEDVMKVLENRASIANSVMLTEAVARGSLASKRLTVALKDLPQNDPFASQLRRMGIQKVLKSTNNQMPVVMVEWSPDGTKVVAIDMDDNIFIWDIMRDMRLNIRQRRTTSKEALHVCWNPSGTSIAVSFRDRTVSIYDIETGREAKVIQLPLSLMAMSLQWSPDETRLCIKHYREDGISVMDLETGELRSPPIGAYYLTSGKPLWSPDSKKVYMVIDRHGETPSERKKAKLLEWNISTNKASLRNLPAFKGDSSSIINIIWNPVKPYLIAVQEFYMSNRIRSMSSKNNIYIVDIRDMKITGTISPNRHIVIDGIVWFPEGKTIGLYIYKSGGIQVWDIRTIEHLGDVSYLNIPEPSGTTMVSRSVVIYRSLSKDRLLATARGDGSMIIQYVPDKKMVETTSRGLTNWFRNMSVSFQ